MNGFEDEFGTASHNMLRAQRSTRHKVYSFPPKHNRRSNCSSAFNPQPQNSHAFTSLFSLCNKPQHLRQIHARFILHGLHQNSQLSSKLIDSYSTQLGCLNLSRKLFYSITNPSTTLYNTFLANLCKFGQYKEALLIFREMIKKSVYPDEYTFPFVFKTCVKQLEVRNGELVHGYAVKSGFDLYDSVGSSLEKMYSEFGGSGDAREVFEEMPVNDVVCWNSLIFEAFQNGEYQECFWIFRRMKMENFEFDSVTGVNMLRTCVSLRCLRSGRYVHGVVYVSGLLGSLDVNTALLTMYSKLGSLEDARLLFQEMPEKDCVVWNLMISGYSRNGYPVKSLEMLMEMSMSGIRADMFTAIAATSSIAELKSLKQGREMHAHMIRNGSDYQVSAHNSLIDMYCKCNFIAAARKVFDFIVNKTVFSWSSIIRGYVMHAQFYDALSLFTKMKLDGFRVDSVIVINILPACVNVGALEQVKYLHGYSIKCNLNSIPSVNTAILVSYAKCGCIEMARKIFDEEDINCRDVISWNSMIGAYSKHGDWIQCFQLYNQMKLSRLKPDRVTFLSVLTACVNSGSIKEGWQCFKEMTEVYDCKPDQEHYACMVDLLGRAGHIKEASELIRSMPFSPDARIWGPLLSACKLHSETRLAEFAAERLINMEPTNAGNYVLLSNIYAAAGKWDGVARMRTFLRDKGLKKIPGSSWLEINGQVHEFRVADKSHPQSYDVYTILETLEFEIKMLMTRNAQKVV